MKLATLIDLDIFLFLFSSIQIKLLKSRTLHHLCFHHTLHEPYLHATCFTCIMYKVADIKVGQVGCQKHNVKDKVGAQGAPKLAVPK